MSDLLSESTLCVHLGCAVSFAEARHNTSIAFTRPPDLPVQQLHVRLFTHSDFSTLGGFTTIAHQKFCSLALWSFGRQTDRLGLPTIVMTKGCKVQLKLMEYLMHYFYTRMKQSCLRDDSI